VKHLVHCQFRFPIAPNFRFLILSAAKDLLFRLFVLRMELARFL